MTVFSIKDYSGNYSNHTLECEVEDVKVLVFHEISGDEVVSIKTSDGDYHWYDSSNCRCEDYFDWEEIIVDPNEIKEWFANRPEYIEEETETIQKKCPICGKTTEIVVSKEQCVGISSFNLLRGEEV